MRDLFQQDDGGWLQDARLRDLMVGERSGDLAQTVLCGLEPVRARFTLPMAANNLARLPKLLAA